MEEGKYELWHNPLPWTFVHLCGLRMQGQEVMPLQPRWTGESHTGCRDMSSKQWGTIFILCTLTDPLMLTGRLLPPQGMAFSFRVSPEIGSSEFAEVRGCNDSPKPCLLPGYKEQAWMQHDEVQKQRISWLSPRYVSDGSPHSQSPHSEDHRLIRQSRESTGCPSQAYPSWCSLQGSSWCLDKD